MPIPPEIRKKLDDHMETALKRRGDVICALRTVLPRIYGFLPSDTLVFYVVARIPWFEEPDSEPPTNYLC